MSKTEATALAREILATGSYTTLHVYPVGGLTAWGGDWAIQIQHITTGRKTTITTRQQWDTILHPRVIIEEEQPE